MIVAVTGANGFVGRATAAALAEAGHAVRALVRGGAETNGIDAAEVRRIPSLGADMDPDALDEALAGADAVVHLAAHLHVMKGGDAEAVYFRVNVEGSVALMRAAARAGVKRFVFVSSVKAAGERTAGAPLNAETPPMPEDPYGRSKLAAERALGEIAAETGMRLVILRPTFVYGWPAVGNFRTVVAAVRKGLPLPLSGIRNRRDMIYVGNLADAIRAALEAETVGTGPYFVCDGEAVSTSDLFRKTARAFGTRARLFPLPAGILRLIGALTGRAGAVERLTESLEVDDAPFRRDAGWLPPYNMADGLKACADACLAAEGRRK